MNLKLSKKLATLGLLLSFVALALAGGPRPFTENQFPQFFLSAANLTTTTSSAETNIYQAILPNNFLGLGGVLRVTYIFNKAQQTNTVTFKTYLGGSGNPPTGATVLATNSVVGSAHVPVVAYYFLNSAQNAPTNWFSFNQTTTNSYNGDLLKINPSLNTGTNGAVGANFTVTGAGDGTNAFGLDGILVEAIAVQ